MGTGGRGLALARRLRVVHWVALAVAVGAASVVVVLVAARDDGSDDQGVAPSAWQDRWPLRGDLADDRELISDALDLSFDYDGHGVPLDNRHALWAGTIVDDGESEQHVIFALEDGDLVAQTARPEATAVLFDVSRSGPDDDWSESGRRPVTSLSPVDSAVAVPWLATSDSNPVNDGPHPSYHAYLLASDVEAASLVQGVANGAPARTSLDIDDGIARYTAADSVPTGGSGGLICANWALRLETAEGVHYATTWPSSSDDLDHVDEAVLASLAAGTTICNDSDADFLDQHLDVTRWLPTQIVVSERPSELTLPDGRRGTVVRVLARKLAVTGRPEQDVWTLAFVPTGGGPAIFGLPPTPVPAADPQAAVSDAVAVWIDGLGVDPGILVFHASADAATTLPALARVAEYQTPLGEGAGLFGPVTTPVAVVFFAGGQPLTTRLVRPPELP